MENNLSLLSFITTSLIILIIPGPGVTYVVTRSLTQGYLAGFVSALGLSVGVLAHVIAAVIGLSAVLLTSATAFAIVKYLGAGYLVYLGIRAISSTRKIDKIQALACQPLRRLFFDGVVISVFNPKISIFFLAFLPQFVIPEFGSETLQILSLGLLYAALALITDSTYGILARSIKNTHRRMFVKDPILQYITGSFLIGLGLKAALTSQRS